MAHAHRDNVNPDQQVQSNLRTIQGRLVMVDVGRPRYKCRIQTSPNSSITCTFDETQREAVLEALTHYVCATGYITEHQGQRETLSLREIEILDQPDDQSSQSPIPRSFFAPTPTIEQLAAEQGVKPVQRFEDLLGDFWPEDQSVDDSLALVRGKRDDADRSE